MGVWCDAVYCIFVRIWWQKEVTKHTKKVCDCCGEREPTHRDGYLNLCCKCFGLCTPDGHDVGLWDIIDALTVIGEIGDDCN